MGHRPLSARAALGPLVARAAKYGGALVAAGYALACLAILRTRPAWQHYSPDSAVKFLQVLSLRVEHGPRYDIPWPGAAYDPLFHAVPLYAQYYDVRGGELHLAWPLLFSILTLPFYRLAGWIGLHVLPIACGALSVWLAARVAERLRPGRGWLAALLTAFASPVLVYGTLFWEHTLALALMLGAVDALVAHAMEPRPRRVVLGAAAVGLAASAIRGDAVLLAAALFGASFVLARGAARWRVALLVAAGFALGAAPGWALNWIANGTPLPSNAVHNTPPPSLAYVREVGLGIFPHFLASNLVSPDSARVVAVALAALLAANLLRGRARAAVGLAALVALGAASWGILRETRASGTAGFHGWLAMSPVLALGALAPRDTRDAPDARRAGRRLVALTAALFGALNTGAIALTYPNGFASNENLEWGPRYWLVIFPLMAILVAVNAGALAPPRSPALLRACGAAVTVALAALSVQYERLGMERIRHNLGEVTTYYDGLLAGGERPLVADVFWLSPISTEQFLRRPSFFVDFAHPEAFAPFMNEAARRGLREFELASFVGPEGHPFLRAPLEDGRRLRVTGVRSAGLLKFIGVSIDGPARW